MADWSYSGGEAVDILGPTACTYGGANVKGAWVQMTAATAFQYEAIGLSIMQDGGDGGAEIFLVDIGIGAAGSEKVIVPNILLDVIRIGQGTLSLHMVLPVQVPKGARVAVRCQTSQGSGTRTARVLLTGKGGGHNNPKGVCNAMQCYGALSASDTNGTLVDSGASANTFGAWTQLTASTAANHNFAQPILGNNKQSSTTSTGVNCEAQLAVGASGSEKIIGHWIFGSMYYTGFMSSLSSIAAQIPAGSRLSMRSKNSAATAADRNMSFVLLAG
jgi:hypothetical protein